MNLHEVFDITGAMMLSHNNAPWGDLMNVIDEKGNIIDNDKFEPLIEEFLRFLTPDAKRRLGKELSREQIKDLIRCMGVVCKETRIDDELFKRKIMEMQEVISGKKTKTKEMEDEVIAILKKSLTERAIYSSSLTKVVGVQAARAFYEQEYRGRDDELEKFINKGAEDVHKNVMPEVNRLFLKVRRMDGTIQSLSEEDLKKAYENLWKVMLFTNSELEKEASALIIAHSAARAMEMAGFTKSNALPEEEMKSSAFWK